ncbi:MAG TPA: cell division protein FtsL [Firmicutes bacterium]|nr:cell division protein FtsL [Bacillota bacterium]
MASYKKRRSYYEIEGNAVRKPEIYVPHEEQAERVRKVRRNRQKALQMSPGFVVFLAAACMFVLAVCVDYLRVQASIDSRISNIQQMEESLENLKDTNEKTQSRIAAASDIQQIYQKATQELGMVYPDDSQVIYYDKTESEYVQQYENIPTE